MKDASAFISRSKARSRRGTVRERHRLRRAVCRAQQERKSKRRIPPNGAARMPMTRMLKRADESDIREIPDDRLANFVTTPLLSFASSIETRPATEHQSVCSTRRGGLGGRSSCSMAYTRIREHDARAGHERFRTGTRHWITGGCRGRPALSLWCYCRRAEGDRPAQDGRAAIFATREGGTVCTPGRKVRRRGPLLQGAPLAAGIST